MLKIRWTTSKDSTHSEDKKSKPEKSPTKSTASSIRSKRVSFSPSTSSLKVKKKMHEGDSLPTETNTDVTFSNSHLNADSISPIKIRSSDQYQGNSVNFTFQEDSPTNYQFTTPDRGWNQSQSGYYMGQGNSDSRINRLDLHKLGFTSDQVNRFPSEKSPNRIKETLIYEGDPSANKSLALGGRSTIKLDHIQDLMQKERPRGNSQSSQQSVIINSKVDAKLFREPEKVVFSNPEKEARAKGYLERYMEKELKGLVNHNEIAQIGYDRFEYKYKQAETIKFGDANSPEALDRIYEQAVTKNVGEKISFSNSRFEGNDKGLMEAKYNIEVDHKNYRKLWGLDQAAAKVVLPKEVQNLYKLDGSGGDTEFKNLNILANNTYTKQIITDFAERNLANEKENLVKPKMSTLPPMNSQGAVILSTNNAIPSYADSPSKNSIKSKLVDIPVEKEIEYVEEYTERDLTQKVTNLAPSFNELSLSPIRRAAETDRSEIPETFEETVKIEKTTAARTGGPSGSGMNYNVGKVSLFETVSTRETNGDATPIKHGGFTLNIEKVRQYNEELEQSPTRPRGVSFKESPRKSSPGEPLRPVSSIRDENSVSETIRGERKSSGVDIQTRRNTLMSLALESKHPTPPRVNYFVVMECVRRFKKNLRRTYEKNRNEYTFYDNRHDPPPVVLKNISGELIRNRDSANRDLLQNYQDEHFNRYDDFGLDYFDFSSYHSEFDFKNLNITAKGDFSEYPYLGPVTKPGVINKIRAGTSNYHERWLVLRGFNLYWYRQAQDIKAKGLIKLPSKPITEDKVPDTGKPCMVIPEGKDGKLIFMLDHVGWPWKYLLTNQIAYKSYLEFLQQQDIHPDSAMINYFLIDSTETVDLSGVIVAGPEKLQLMFDSFSFHHGLKEVKLTNARISIAVFEKLLKALDNKRNRIEALILDDCGITVDYLPYLEKFLQAEASFNLVTLSLAGNPLGDKGVQKLCDTLYGRFNTINTKGKTRNLQLPLLSLNLARIGMADQGLFALIGLFDKIYKVMDAKGEHTFDKLMTLNFSENSISDNPMKAMINLISYFQVVETLDLSSNARLTEESFKALLKGLCKSYSCSKVLYHKNKIDEECVETMLQSLEDNFILKNFTITIPKALYKSLSQNFKMIMKYYKISPYV